MAGKGITVDFNADIARFTSNIDKITNDLSKFQTNADRVSKQVNKSFSFLATSIKGSFAGVTAGLSLAEYGKLADTFQNIQSRLKLATRDANEFAQANDNIKRIASSSQSSLESTATLYTRISQSLLEVGGTQKQVADVTQALALALRISGATAEESSSAMLQFSQAMSSGVLRGEEFNAVNEAAPRAMKALADALGVPTGALRKMAEEGKITRDILVDAFSSQLPKLAKEAETLPQTIGAAFTNLKNEVLLAVGEIDKITKASSTAAQALNLISQGISGWKDFISPSDEQQIIKRLNFISKSIDDILLRRELLGKIGLDSSSFFSGDLNKLNAEALQLQKSLQKLRDDGAAADQASAQAAEQAAAAAKKKADEAAKAAQAEKLRIDAQKAAEAAAKSLASQQQSFIAGLEKEAATLGMTAAQVKVYEASLLKISGPRLALVQASADRIEAFKKEQAALTDQIAFETRQKEQFYAEQERMAKEAQQSLEAMSREGSNLKLSVDPIAKMNAELERYSELLEAGAIDQKTFDLAVQKSTENMKKATKDGFEEMSSSAIAFKTNMQSTLGQGLYNAMTGKFDSIFEAWKDLLFRMVSAGLAAQVSDSLLGKDGGKLLSLISSLAGGVGGLFGGGKSPGGTVLGSSNFGQFLWPSAKGSYFDGNVAAFANGGIVSSPTLFKFESGGAIRNGLMGEAGPEAIMPLKRDSKGRLGVSGGGGGVVINDNRVINIDSRSDRASILQDVQKLNKQSNAELVERLERQRRL